MFSSRNNKNKSTTGNRKAVLSIISADLNILGNLVSEGNIDVDGRIEGNVSAHSVIIRKAGIIIGDIQADEIHIYGKVKGLVRAKDVHLYNTSKVKGNIMHEALSIEDGADVDGQFKRIDRVRLQDMGMLERVEPETLNHSEDDIKLLESIRLISTNPSN